MAEYLIQDTTLDAIADAINAKTGGSSAMTPAEMVTAIGTISGGGDEQGFLTYAVENASVDGGTLSVAMNANRISFSASRSYVTTIAWLKKPVAINNGDVIDLKISNAVHANAFVNITAVVCAGSKHINLQSNVYFSSNTFTTTWEKGTLLLMGIGFQNRNTSWEDVSFDIQLDINGVRIA